MRDLRYLEDFFCAGTSALLISLAHFSEGLWFVSLFALVPFLWRVTRTGLTESIFVGVCFAFSWTLAAAHATVVASPASLLLHFLLVGTLLAVYGAAANILSRYVGFSAVLLAAPWLPVEHILGLHDRLDSLLAFPGTDSAFLIRLGSLFGVLMVSFFVLAVNLLILDFVQGFARTKLRRSPMAKSAPRQTHGSSETTAVGARFCFIPNLRAPPFESADA